MKWRIKSHGPQEPIVSEMDQPIDEGFDIDEIGSEKKLGARFR